MCYVSSAYEFPSANNYEKKFQIDCYEFTKSMRTFKFDFIYFNFVAEADCSFEIRVRFLTEEEFIERNKSKLFSEHSSSGMKIKLNETLELLHSNTLYRNALHKLSNSILEKKKTVYNRSLFNFIKLNRQKTLYLQKNTSLENIKSLAVKETQRIRNARTRKRIKSSYDLAESIIKTERESIKTQRKIFICNAKNTLQSEKLLFKHYILCIRFIKYLSFIKKTINVPMKEATLYRIRKFSISKIIFQFTQLIKHKYGDFNKMRILSALSYASLENITHKLHHKEMSNRIIYTYSQSLLEKISFKKNLTLYNRLITLLIRNIRRYNTKQKVRTQYVMSYWDLVGQTYMSIASAHQKLQHSSKLYKKGLLYKTFSDLDKRIACRRYVRMQTVEFKQVAAKYCQDNNMPIEVLMKQLKARPPQSFESIHNKIKEQISKLKSIVKIQLGIKKSSKKQQNMSDNLIESKKKRLIPEFVIDIIRPVDEFEGYMELYIDSHKMQKKKKLKKGSIILS